MRVANVRARALQSALSSLEISKVRYERIRELMNSLLPRASVHEAHETTLILLNPGRYENVENVEFVSVEPVGDVVEFKHLVGCVERLANEAVFLWISFAFKALEVSAPQHIPTRTVEIAGTCVNIRKYGS